MKLIYMDMKMSNIAILNSDENVTGVRQVWPAF